jgi:hypothetical protein
MSETITRQLIREESSAQIKVRFRGTGSGSAGANITVVEFSDIFTESLAPLAAYLSPAGDPTNFRRITGFTDTTGAIVLNRASVANGPVDAHFILTGQDWIDCINQSLRSLYFTDRVTIAPVDGQSLYPLQADAPWLHSEHQIEKLKFRWTPAGSPAWISEQDAVVLDIIEDGNTLDLLFGAMPDATDATLSIFIEGRHYYEDLATEAATTTCPEQLIKAQTTVFALRKIWSIMGEREAKAMFQQELADAEGLLVDEKKRHIDQVEARPFRVDKAQSGPDMAMPANYRW